MGYFVNISVWMNTHGDKAFLLKTTFKIYLHFHVEQDKYPCSLKTELNDFSNVFAIEMPD